MSFGCAFGDQKDNHHFVRLKASKMNAFTPPQLMPGMPPNQASMFSTLMAAARAKATLYMRFINDDENELEIDDDEDDDGEDDALMPENWFGLAPPPAAAHITNNNHVAPAFVRFTRAKVPRMKQYVSTPGGRDTWHRK